MLQPAWFDVSSISCLFVMMERLEVWRLASDSMLATCGVLLCLFVWLVASQNKKRFVVKGMSVVTMPDNRCFLAFLFWLVTEGEGT